MSLIKTRITPILINLLSKRTLTNCIYQNNKNILFNTSIISTQNSFTYLQRTHIPLIVTARTYAKNKDIKKSKGKKKVEINAAELAEVLNVKDYEADLQRPINILKEEFVKQLSLRSTTGAIESLPIALDGKEYTLQDLAQIVRKNPKTIVVNMITFPQAIPAALKALEKSGMNLNPQQDGTTLFIPVPKVTKEHREGLAKNAKVLFVKCKDSIRSVQMKNIRNVKKQENISSDLSFSVQNQIISIADQYILQAEKILETKQAELLGKD